MSAAVKAEVAARFDACAANGLGPFQQMADDAFPQIARAVVNDDFEIPESAFWCFIRDRYGWAVLEHEALEHIATRHRGGRVLDIGAGSGYVAACLASRGVKVTAVHLPLTWQGWWKRQFFPTIPTPASRLVYDADAYLMLMPDGSGGEDMMFEALSRMPEGAVCYLYAPSECAGSRRGADYLARHFLRVADIPLLNCFPYEPSERECGEWVKLAVGTSQLAPASDASVVEGEGSRDEPQPPPNTGREPR